MSSIHTRVLEKVKTKDFYLMIKLFLEEKETPKDLSSSFQEETIKGITQYFEITTI
jgi:dihydroorotase